MLGNVRRVPEVRAHLILTQSHQTGIILLIIFNHHFTDREATTQRG